LIAVVSAVAVICLSHLAMAQMKAGSSENYRPQAKNDANQNQLAQKGTGGAAVAKQVTPEEAVKKYPAKGKYPMGERDPHKPDGIVNSPYPPRTEFDCSQVPHGGLVLDTHVNKVFVRP
jgi:hypothetical protein